MRTLLGAILLLFNALALAENNREDYKTSHHESLEAIIFLSLEGDGLDTFDGITAKVKNNIHWSSGKTVNPYIKAYQRCYPFLQSSKIRNKMPSFVFLIVYLESACRADVGNLNHDFGYWQMIPEVVDEIRQLPEASEALALASTHKVRISQTLSTEAAFIHLRRYYFYFRHVANFEDEDAWMFTLVAFNWGAGNVKRMLIDMGNEGKERSFSAFYHYLVARSAVRRKDKSMRVAVEYIPNLWNIALLLICKRL